MTRLCGEDAWSQPGLGKNVQSHEAQNKKVEQDMSCAFSMFHDFHQASQAIRI